MQKKCSVDNCDSVSRCLGYCEKHYARFRRYGNPLTVFKIKGIRRLKNQEYVYIAEKALGKKLPKGAKVHHANGDHNDNRNSNLVICPDQKYHSLLHLRMRSLEAVGRVDYRKCNICKQWDDPKNLSARNSKKTAFQHNECRRMRYVKKSNTPAQRDQSVTRKLL